MKAEEIQNVDHLEIDRRVKNYWLQKGLGITGIVLVVLHGLLLLMGLDRVMWIWGYTNMITRICVILLHYVLVQILVFVVLGAGSWISGSLTKSCDPFLYEACLYRVGTGVKKQMNLALAQYYEGNFEQAWDTLSRINEGELKKKYKMNYYLIKSWLLFRQGRGNEVRNLEDEFQRRISGKEDTLNMQILCASNNMRRALENKDYASAYSFLQEYMRLRRYDGQLWDKVGIAYWEGFLDQRCHNETGAKARFDFVKKYGGKLFYVQEIDKKAAEEPTAAESQNKAATAKEQNETVVTDMQNEKEEDINEGRVYREASADSSGEVSEDV